VTRPSRGREEGEIANPPLNLGPREGLLCRMQYDKRESSIPGAAVKP